MSPPFCTGGNLEPPFGSTMSHQGFTYPSPDYLCVVFLFKGAVLNSAVKYAFAALGTAGLGVVEQALFYARRKSISKRVANKRARWVAHFLVAALQLIVANWIMIIAMTFSAPLLAMAVLGLTVGYFFFNREVVSDHVCGCGGSSEYTCERPGTPASSSSDVAASQ